MIPREKIVSDILFGRVGIALPILILGTWNILSILIQLDTALRQSFRYGIIMVNQKPFYKDIIFAIDITGSKLFDHAACRSVFSPLAGISLPLSLKARLAASILQYGGGAVPLLLTRKGWTAPSLGLSAATFLRLDLFSMQKTTKAAEDMAKIMGTVAAKANVILL